MNSKEYQLEKTKLEEYEKIQVKITMHNKVIDHYEEYGEHHSSGMRITSHYVNGSIDKSSSVISRATASKIVAMLEEEIKDFKAKQQKL